MDAASAQFQSPGGPRVFEAVLPPAAGSCLDGVDLTELGGRSVWNEAMFRELYPGLRRFAAAVGDADIEPDDLVQSALARVLERQDIGALDDAGAYLRSVVYSLASNERRRLGRRREAVSRLTRSAAEKDAYPSDLSFLDSVGPTERALLYLVHVEGRSFDDTAELLGMTPQAARARASRARRTLRSALVRREKQS